MSDNIMVYKNDAVSFVYFEFGRDEISSETFRWNAPPIFSLAAGSAGFFSEPGEQPFNINRYRSNRGICL